MTTRVLTSTTTRLTTDASDRTTTSAVVPQEWFASPPLTVGVTAVSGAFASSLQTWEGSVPPLITVAVGITGFLDGGAPVVDELEVEDVYAQSVVKGVGKPLTGQVYLTETNLGTLSLIDPGWVVTNIQVGTPTERPVVRPRALNDGLIDESSVGGGRVITLTLTFQNRVLPIQTLLDRISPYLTPSVRPRLVWSLPDTPEELRSAPVRCISAPFVLDGPLFPTMTIQFLTANSFLQSPTQRSQTLVPSTASELGRAYDLDFDRVYPEQPPFGSFEIENRGNAPADWVGTILVGSAGNIVNPTIEVNGIDVVADQNSGVTLTVGQTLWINTRNRTVLLNNDPTLPRYDRLNFLDWTWEALRLQKGGNLIRFDHGGSSGEAAFTIRWFDTWM